MDFSLSLHLDNYDGPLDVLLDLIRKQQLNIFDIPIAQITKQYTELLARMEQLDVDIAGDFVLMASTLVHIKSKLLLPRDPDTPLDAEPDDPRAGLMQQLLEHEKFKNAAQMLREKQMIEQVTWTKPDLDTFASEQGELVVTLWDLVKAFQEALASPPQEVIYDIVREELTIAQMIEEIRTVLQSREEPVPLRDLWRRFPTRRGLITLFLALLELIRLEAVVAVQSELFATIVLRKHRLFDTVFGGKTAAKIDEYQ